GAAVAALATRIAMLPADSSQIVETTLGAEREAFTRSLEERRTAGAEIEARLRALAAAAGYASDEEFLQDYREAGSHQDKTAERASLKRRREEAASLLKLAMSSIRTVMHAGGHVPRFGVVTPRTARRFRALATICRETLSRIDEMRERRRASDRQIGDLERQRAAQLKDVAAILGSARMEPAADLDEAIRRFEEGIARRDRYGALKRDVIPALVRRSLTHRGDSLKRAVEIADSVLRRRVAEAPELAALGPRKSHKEYVEERSRLQDESRSLAERRAQLSAELSEVLREYRKEYPDALRWLAEWTEVRERAAAFKGSVDLACSVLEELSREAYAEWAEVLNERASETLALVSHGYDDLRFDDDLTFTVRDRGDRSRRGVDDVNHRLSAGARDQIYFSARLAMAEYLSSGRVKLPLILDDPFATFDDERFARAMEVIIDRFGRRHQVILLSCHESRHRAWQEREPERFAERVRVMALQSPVT
ncbi:MAG TPA: hypothetical protein VE404_04790, partial [Verrucomicrobiae bacterium]|nr:hypothetical protein [Verrucomicrobiae bacterium]